MLTAACIIPTYLLPPSCETNAIVTSNDCAEVELRFPSNPLHSLWTALQESLSTAPPYPAWALEVNTTINVLTLVTIICITYAHTENGIRERYNEMLIADLIKTCWIYVLVPLQAASSL
jgi:hypothetical protein